ncbi:hypothetical protein ABT272_44405 [Streptomyces sp900105245]|uniref:Uncharacterized protein n=1 Tax=Streptomyces sp. 900105245 TaxID=3154379 RepID=A0ABV1UMY3_9ACTN
MVQFSGAVEVSALRRTRRSSRPAVRPLDNPRQKIAGLHDRSRKPRTTPPRATPAGKAWVWRMRTDRKFVPACIGPVLGSPASAMHRILARQILNCLTRLDRLTGAVVRHYERTGRANSFTSA